MTSNQEWIPYQEWETYHHGLYATPAVTAALVTASAALLADAHTFHTICRDTVTNWPRATLHSLTDLGSNRRAWLGQAACCYAHGAPDVATCRAWWTLGAQSRSNANAAAQHVIAEWTDNRARIGRLW